MADLGPYAGVSWSGAVLATVPVPLQFLDELSSGFEARILPMSVRRVDERTIQYSDDPVTVFARFVPGNDPWVRTIDPAAWQKWVTELGCEPVTYLVLTARQYSRLDEPLLIHLAWTVGHNYHDRNVLAWDFNQSCLFEAHSIEWNHEVNVIRGTEQPYGQDNPDPQHMSKEERDASYQALLDEYNASLQNLRGARRRRKPFWRRLCVVNVFAEGDRKHGLQPVGSKKLAEAGDRRFGKPVVRISELSCQY